jgi:hypothetical protein
MSNGAGWRPALLDSVNQRALQNKMRVRELALREAFFCLAFFGFFLAKKRTNSSKSTSVKI